MNSENEKYLRRRTCTRCKLLSTWRIFTPWCLVLREMPLSSSTFTLPPLAHYFFSQQLKRDSTSTPEAHGLVCACVCVYISIYRLMQAFVKHAPALLWQSQVHPWNPHFKYQVAAKPLSISRLIALHCKNQVFLQVRLSHYLWRWFFQSLVAYASVYAVLCTEKGDWRKIFSLTRTVKRIN